jgi:hypothetical protein
MHRAKVNILASDLDRFGICEGFSTSDPQPLHIAVPGCPHSIHKVVNRGVWAVAQQRLA